VLAFNPTLTSRLATRSSRSLVGRRARTSGLRRVAPPSCADERGERVLEDERDIATHGAQIIAA
jgi:hypothetical protein